MTHIWRNSDYVTNTYIISNTYKLHRLKHVVAYLETCGTYAKCENMRFSKVPKYAKKHVTCRFSKETITAYYTK